mgnify:CR=1 FL=1
MEISKEITHVKAIKMGTRVTPVSEEEVRELRREAPDVTLITCHGESLMT